MQQKLTKQGFVQFIPIYTTKNTTSYDYSVSINDENIRFDVYFVPSKEQFDNYLKDQSFEFYTNGNCFARNYHSFSGTCNDVSPDAGLIIMIPDRLDLSLTKIKINLHEKT